MLKKTNRFHGRAALMFVFRRGKLTRSSACQLRSAPRAGKDLRAAVVVSKKVSKSAVVRNRIRRRVFTFVEQNLKKLDHNDLIITIFDVHFAEMASAQVEAELNKLFKSAGLL